MNARLHQHGDFQERNSRSKGHVLGVPAAQCFLEVRGGGEGTAFPPVGQQGLTLFSPLPVIKLLDHGHSKKKMTPFLQFGFTFFNYASFVYFSVNPYFLLGCWFFLSICLEELFVYWGNLPFVILDANIFPS